MYTSNQISNAPGQPELIAVVFHGNSRRALRGFSDEAKQDLGYALYQLQLGQTPEDRKSVAQVGAGVYELREQVARTWYRILYVRRVKVIHVLHCFEKRSNKIEQKDVETAKARLKRVLEAEREEKRSAQKAHHRK
jgi:phage-related protein